MIRGCTVVDDVALLPDQLWLALPACAALLLLAVTNQVTMDVAAIPFLWVRLYEPVARLMLE